MTQWLPRVLCLLAATLLIVPFTGAVSTVTLQQDRINMNGGSITNFFAAPCSGQSIVDGINADGSYSCTTNIPTNDVYVNESGDTMTGTLDMGGNNITNIGAGSIQIADPQGDLVMDMNRIEGLQAADSGDDAMRQDTIDTTYVNEGGDTMTGNLDLGSNDVINVQNLGIGTAAAQTGLQIDRPESDSAPGGGVFLSGGSTGNANLELRGNFTTPYIDFANNTANDYDARLRWHSDYLDIESTDVHISAGNLDMNGNNITNAWSNSFRLPVGPDAY